MIHFFHVKIDSNWDFIFQGFDLLAIFSLEIQNLE